MTAVIGIFGSRNGVSDTLLEGYINMLEMMYDRSFKIVVGDCIGVDEQTYRLCKNRGITVEVIQVQNNWSRISYKPDIEDVIITVGGKSLKNRLVRRSLKLVEYVDENNGFLVGFNAWGSGSRLVINEALNRRMDIQIFNEG